MWQNRFLTHGVVTLSFFGRKSQRLVDLQATQAASFVRSEVRTWRSNDELFRLTRQYRAPPSFPSDCEGTYYKPDIIENTPG